MSGFETEFEFTLPKGYLDTDGVLHREGIMRLATGADEILPLKDPRVQSNPSYLIFILLSRVIVSLGTISAINPRVVEGMFSQDLAYLQEFYNNINGQGPRSVTCPHCSNSFEIRPESLGE